jgi:uncharacterized protein YkwD
MFRVVIPVVVCAALAACSGARSSTSLGMAEAVDPPARVSDRATRTGAIDKKADDKGGARVAALPDKAPSGSWEKAPRGALADRNYTEAKLDIEQARSLINAYRRQKGLKALEVNSQLTLAAKEHSRDLAKWDRISHYGSDGSNPWDRVKRTGYNPKVAAENVGTGQATIDEVFKGWQQSEGHNKNLLLPDATHMGIALVHDSKTEFKTFWTLVLGSPLGGAVAQR